MTSRTFRLFDGCRGVVDVTDVLGRVGDPPHLVEQRGVQDRRVQGAPGVGAVRTDGAGQQSRVGAVHQVEAPVAGEEERVAGGRRFGQNAEGPGERPFDLLDAEVAGQRFQGPGNRQVAQEPVDGADLQRVAGRVDEEDQAVVPGARGGLFPLEPEVGRPAVVAVRDERLVPGEVRLDLAPVRRVRHRPQPVPEAVLRRRREQRFPQDRAVDDRGRPRRRAPVAAVRQQQRLQMGPCRTHQLRAVRDDVVHDVLVGQHDALVGGGERQCADQAPLEDLVVALLVDVQRRVRVRGDDPLGQPAVQRVGRLPVPVPGRVGLGEDEAHDVVRIRGLQVVQPVRPDDHVVRGRGHGGKTADPLGDVTQSAERDQPQPLVDGT
ncbi:hypothetical protein SBADM41S_11070 [Streptomyces badius]